MDDSRHRKDASREPRVHAPVTPGRFIELEFLEPLEMSVPDLARGIRISENRAKVLVSEDGRIDGELALRLSTYFGNSARFWMNLQNQYDLQAAEITFGEQIEREVKPKD